MRGLNTFRRRHSYRRWLRELLAVLASLCLSVACTAEGTSKPLSQYLHEQWGSEKGFPGGSINAIAQTPDGYLWMGTQNGLVRFDGWNFRLFSQMTKNSNATSPVLGLLVDSEGSLWVRLQGPGLLRYRDGNFEDFSNTFDHSEIAVTQIGRTADGRAMFAGVRNGAITYEDGKFINVAPPPELPDFIVTSIAARPDGGYWIGTRDLGLFQIRDGTMSARRDILGERQINVLLSASSERLWIGTDKGLFLWNGHEVTHIGSTSLREQQILSLANDSDGNIWVGTDHGMYRLGPESNFTPKVENTLGNGSVPAIFADREGNIWAATPNGLERLRNTIFTTYGAAEGLPGESNGPVHVDSDGRIWFAPIRGGLYWLKNKKTGVIREAGLDKDVVYSIASGAGDHLWVARQRGGLTHLQNVGGKWQYFTYTAADGLAQDSVYSVRVTRNGAVWAGTLSAGLTRISSGKFDRFTTANGLISNTISSILESRNGTMWFATPRGLSAFSNNHWLSYSSNDGLPSDDVNCLFEDAEGTLWIGTMSGLAALRSGHIWVSAHGPDILSEPIFGIQEDTNGFLWISASNHIAMINRKKLLGHDLSDVDVRQFGLADGLRNTDGVKRDEAVASDQSGKIWFSLNRGLSVVDTNRLRRESPASILHLEGLSVDGSPTSFQNSVRISPNPKRITFNYAGVSLSVPDRVRFRYKLDGFDSTWSEPLAASEASYTNLNPGSYLFRVIASNSDGLWNGNELTVPFTIERAFWQTAWFETSCAVSILLLVWFAHRYRVYRLTSEVNMRLEERVSERTRIARSLHDTLLQSFQGILLKIHAVTYIIAERPAEACTMLQTTIEEAGQAITEGRDAVQGLRSTTVVTNDLMQALSKLGDQLAIKSRGNHSADFRVVLEGTPRKVAMAVGEEVYRVASEALRNAFQHAQAERIEVELRFDQRELRLRIRDNGKGICPEVLAAGGRDGHYGLVGMQERANIIGGRLTIWSELDSGTETELKVPASVAYSKAGSPSRLKSWRQGA